jgi:hypothetical protein
VLNGAGAPSNELGTNGDFYLDTTASTLYGPKASGVWPGTGVSLVGPGGSITDGSVTTAKLAAGAVTAAKLATGAVTSAAVDSAGVQLRVSGSCAPGASIRVIAQNGAVTCETDDLGTVAAGSITESELANGAVTSPKIALGAVTGERAGTKNVVIGPSSFAAVTTGESNVGLGPHWRQTLQEAATQQ